MGEVRGLLSAHFAQPTLAYLMALVDLENGAGQDIWDHNWGNITTNNRDPSVSFQFPSDSKRFFLRSSSHAEGAANFIRRLGSATHQRMLDAAERNDFEAFWRGYTKPHPVTRMVYCDTCDFPAAKRNMRSLVEKYLPQGITAPSDSRALEKSGAGWWIGAGLLTAAAVGGGVWYWNKTRGRRADS